MLFALAAPAGAQQSETAQPTRATEVTTSGILKLGRGELPDDLIPECVVLSPAQQYRVAPTCIDDPPRLDGVFDEEAWLSAAVIEDFIQ